MYLLFNLYRSFSHFNPACFSWPFDAKSSCAWLVLFNVLESVRTWGPEAIFGTSQACWKEGSMIQSFETCHFFIDSSWMDIDIDSILNKPDCYCSISYDVSTFFDWRASTGDNFYDRYGLFSVSLFAQLNKEAQAVPLLVPCKHPVYDCADWTFVRWSYMRHKSWLIQRTGSQAISPLLPRIFTTFSCPFNGQNILQHVISMLKLCGGHCFGCFWGWWNWYVLKEQSFAEATPGNHDYWFNGVPSLAANSWLLGYDQFANGQAQFFAQVTWLLNEVTEWDPKDRRWPWWHPKISVGIVWVKDVVWYGMLTCSPSKTRDSQTVLEYVSDVTILLVDRTCTASKTTS